MAGDSRENIVRIYRHRKKQLTSSIEYIINLSRLITLHRYRLMFKDIVDILSLNRSGISRQFKNLLYHLGGEECKLNKIYTIQIHFYCKAKIIKISYNIWEILREYIEFFFFWIQLYFIHLEYTYLVNYIIRYGLIFGLMKYNNLLSLEFVCSLFTVSWHLSQ